VQEVEVELRRARELFSPLNSSHEGLGVLLEEFVELVLAVKSNDPAAARVEALQVAAMGARFAMDLDPEQEERERRE